MISIPITCDVIARISWKGYSVIQKVNLSSYEAIMLKLPRGTRIDILVYLANNQYGWSTLQNVTIDDSVSMNYTTTNYKGISVYVPASSKVSFVQLTQDRFERPIRLGDYLLGLLALTKVKTLRIEQKKNTYNDLASFLRRGDQNIKPKVFINNREFDWETFLDKNNVLDYLREYYSNKMDVYLTHLMIRSGFLAPVIFSGVDLTSLICDDKLRVPLENYWIFYLMYGKQLDIVSELHDNEEFRLKDVVLRKTHPTYLKEPRVILHMESKVNKPVIINGLFPMRFRDKG
jgi:hypothetical protein